MSQTTGYLGPACFKLVELREPSGRLDGRKRLPDAPAKDLLCRDTEFVEYHPQPLSPCLRMHMEVSVDDGPLCSFGKFGPSLAEEVQPHAVTGGGLLKRAVLMFLKFGAAELGAGPSLGAVPVLSPSNHVSALVLDFVVDTGDIKGVHQRPAIIGDVSPVTDTPMTCSHLIVEPPLASSSEILKVPRRASSLRCNRVSTSKRSVHRYRSRLAAFHSAASS